MAERWTAIATDSDGNERELRVRQLEVGEVVEAPHRQVKDGLEYYEDPRTQRRFPNDQCDGTVTVRGPIPGAEYLASECLIGCDDCEYTRVDERLVIA